jgi:hypothetical protein
MIMAAMFACVLVIVNIGFSPVCVVVRMLMMVSMAVHVLMLVRMEPAVVGVLVGVNMSVLMRMVMGVGMISLHNVLPGYLLECLNLPANRRLVKSTQV